MMEADRQSSFDRQSHVFRFLKSLEPKKLTKAFPTILKAHCLSVGSISPDVHAAQASGINNVEREYETAQGRTLPICLLSVG